MQSIEIMFSILVNLEMTLNDKLRCMDVKEDLKYIPLGMFQLIVTFLISCDGIVLVTETIKSNATAHMLHLSNHLK